MTEDDLPLSEDVGPVDAPAIEVPDDTPTEANDTPPPSLEDIAANMGWSPKEQWRGDAGKWKPAHEFVAATADINAKLATKIKSVDEQLANISRTNAAMLERALAEQRKQLLQERQEAFDVGDRERFDAADQQLKQIPSAVPKAPPAPEVQAFAEKHAAWFQKDQEATNWAFNRAEELAKQGLSAPRQLAIVERELGTYFPEYADKPKPKAVALSQPGNRASTTRAKTFADLPAEAQKAARDFAATGKVTLEQYVASYFQTQEA